MHSLIIINMASCARSCGTMVIVGAGPTGSLTASLITKKLPEIKVYLWEKAKGCGGRMTTHRSTLQHVDMGAQYITRYKHDPSESQEVHQFKNEIYSALLKDEVLLPFQGSIEGSISTNTDFLGRYVCQKGLSAVPKYFLEKAKVCVTYGNQLESLEVKDRQVIMTSTNGLVLIADTVILTLPVPQCLALKGNFMKEVPLSTLHQLQQVVYSSRYAVGLFFEDQIPDTTWTGKYFDHSIIRYACWDTLKYMKDRPLLPNESTLLVHSSVPFGLQALEDDKEKVYHTIMEALSQLIPNLPTPSHSHLIRWRYSQVYKSYPDSPGCITLCNQPLIILTGDGLTHSNFEGCIEAAHTTVNEILQ